MQNLLASPLGGDINTEAEAVQEEGTLRCFYILLSVVTTWLYFQYQFISAWLNVTELNPTQQAQVGCLITSMINDYRRERHRPLLPNVLQPVYFNKQAQTPATSATPLVN